MKLTNIPPRMMNNRCQAGLERNSQVCQTDNRADIVIAVQSGNNQVSSLSGMRGDFCCFLVADLSDADDIGVLAQGISQQ